MSPDVRAARARANGEAQRLPAPSQHDAARGLDDHLMETKVVIEVRVELVRSRHMTVDLTPKGRSEMVEEVPL
jgi:hypothetical protein